MIVLDASIAVSWLLDEGPASDLDSVLVTRSILVPAHWTIEVGHGILKALRRRAISQTHLNGIATDLDALTISIEPPIGTAAVIPLLAFAREQGLTMYDAAYVQLARDRHAELATLDQAMGSAAVRLGIALFPA